MGFALQRGLGGGARNSGRVGFWCCCRGGSKAEQRPDCGNVGDVGEKPNPSIGAGVGLKGREQTGSIPCRGAERGALPVSAGGSHEVSRRKGTGPWQGNRRMRFRIPMPHCGHKRRLLAVSAASQSRQAAGWGSSAEQGVASSRRHNSSFSARWQLARKP